MPMGWKMARDLEVRHCRTLIAVHDCGGVGAAARALGVAQSTVSETLLSLERMLGGQVTIRRIGREAVLSEAALRLLPHARALVAASQAALAAAARPGRTTLRLGAVESVSSFLLPVPLGAFRRRWPQVEVRIVVGLCADLNRLVESGELDAALTVETPGDADAARLELWRTEMTLVAAPAHALAGQAILPGDLEGRRYLITESSGSVQKMLEGWIGRSRGVALASAGSVDGVKAGVLADDAIGVLPRYAVARDIAEGRLIEIASAARPDISVFLARSVGRFQSSAFDDFLSELAGSLSKREGRATDQFA